MMVVEQNWGLLSESEPSQVPFEGLSPLVNEMYAGYSCLLQCPFLRVRFRDFCGTVMTAIVYDDTESLSK